MSAIAMIAEKDATGKVKDIYTEIMVNIGIDFVPNMYKVMVVKPNNFESNWNMIQEQTPLQKSDDVFSEMVPPLGGRALVLKKICHHLLPRYAKTALGNNRVNG